MQPTFKQFLTEAFDKPLEWKWLGADAASFEIENKTVTVYLEHMESQGYHNVVFEVDGHFGDVNFEEASSSFKVMATVMDIIHSYITKNDVEKLMFTADKSQKGSNRASMYERLIKRYLPNNYEYQTQDKRKDSLFIIKKKEQ